MIAVVVQCIGQSLFTASEDTTFCLKGCEDGQYTLKRKRTYFKQIQLQMLCDVNYCDFVIGELMNSLILELTEMTYS